MKTGEKNQYAVEKSKL